MYESVLPSVLNAYEIKYSKVFPFQKGYRNEIWPVLTSDGQMINVTFFKKEPGIVDRVKRADAISSYLASCGLPARTRFDMRTISLEYSSVVVYAGVYNYLPGDTIPWEAYTMERIKALGAMMGDMHFNLQTKNDIKLPSVYDEYLVIVDRMNQYFLRAGVKKAATTKLGVRLDQTVFEKYKILLNKYKQQPNQQPLHMDFVRGNILFENKKISGILDFEKVGDGNTIVDISRTLAFLLVDCKYKQSDKITKYFLSSGYQKRGRSKDIGNEIDRNQFVQMFLVYDLYKFLDHNPYESLVDNEHFIRTRDILIDIGVLSFI